MIFCSVLWQATKVGFTISTLQRSGRVWNGIIWIHQQKRNQKQFHQLRLWATSSGMQRGESWLNFWNLGKPYMLLVMSRHYSSFVVHCAINVPEERSSRSTITLSPTLFVWPRKKLRTWGGKFSLALSTVLVWHPPFAISLVLWRIRCEANITRRTRHSRQLCVNVFGQLERISTAREYSNFHNGGKNVYRETGIM